MVVKLVVKLAVKFCRCVGGGATCGAQLPDTPHRRKLEHSAHPWRTNPDLQITNYTLPAGVRAVLVRRVAAIDALPRSKDECPGSY